MDYNKGLGLNTINTGLSIRFEVGGDILKGAGAGDRRPSRGKGSGNWRGPQLSTGAEPIGGLAPKQNEFAGFSPNIEVEGE